MYPTNIIIGKSLYYIHRSADKNLKKKYGRNVIDIWSKRFQLQKKKSVLVYN